jgi:Zn-dependent M28 family amino/carboxypeptidase
VVVVILALGFIPIIFQSRLSSTGFGDAFDGQRAYQDVLTQMAFGARYPGSKGHAQTRAWMMHELAAAGWRVEVQQLEYGGVTVRNVIAYSEEKPSAPWVILGAHYDTRLFADQENDAASASQPVPGANDGASGVAVLVELARVMPPEIRDHIWLVFFDYEDQGGIHGLDWTLGSRAFVEQLDNQPDQVVIVDMIGDADLKLYYEVASDDALKAEIWGIALDLGKAQFIPEDKHHILDDHTAFLLAGIPAVDIIDFEYPYWHTLEDTEEKVSPNSLSAVGDVLLEWLRRSIP